MLSLKGRARRRFLKTTGLATAATSLAAMVPAEAKESSKGTSGANALVHNKSDVGEGVQLHYVTAGEGEPLVLLHGWPTTWYEWRHVIPLLATKYRVIAPDLRGLGDSSRPRTGYDKRTVAEDVWRLMTRVLKYKSWYLVGHDWGGPTAYSLAAGHPQDIRRLAILDVAPPLEAYPAGPGWHARFHAVPELPEALVGGREAIYLGWFYRNLAHPSYDMPQEALTEYLRTYTQPEALRAGFELYRALPKDVADNTELAKTKLPMPVLAIQGGGPTKGWPDRRASKNTVAERMRLLANDVSEVIFEETGHWIPEERPQLLADTLVKFFSESRAG